MLTINLTMMQLRRSFLSCQIIWNKFVEISAGWINALFKFISLQENVSSSISVEEILKGN